MCGDVSMSGNFGARAIWKHFGSGVGLFLTEMPEMKMAKKNFLHMTHRVSGDLRGVVAYLCAICLCYLGCEIYR